MAAGPPQAHAEECATRDGWPYPHRQQGTGEDSMKRWRTPLVVTAVTVFVVLAALNTPFHHPLLIVAVGSLTLFAVILAIRDHRSRR